MNDLARFAEHYRGQYGLAIDKLLDKLISYDDKIALINPFIPKNLLSDILAQGREESMLGLTYYVLPKEVTARPINNLMSHYFLDRSSLIAPLLLPIAPGMRVLDMCAAPGGKLLVMLSRLISDVTFVANDASSARAERLRRVIKAFVPAKVAQNIIITNKDASSFALKNPQTFDAVLLDAPCSSEQHVIKNPHLLKEFKGLRKGVALRQYSLLCSALLAVKPQQHIMYATCSINQHENQGVIKKLLKKKGDICQIINLCSPLGEACEYGTTMLPHMHQAGPAFCSVIKKNL